jgi:hypothetical protein
VNFVTAGGVLIGISAAVAFALLFCALVRRDRFAGINAEWLGSFSVARYRPMERLLAEEDFDFLASQRGYAPSIARRLRSERRKIFREYLRCLWRDFGRLEAAVRLLMVNSSEDRPELAQALLRQRLLFTRGIVAAEFRLILYGLGLGTVNVQGLVGSLNAMHTCAGELALARQSSLA